MADPLKASDVVVTERSMSLTPGKPPEMAHVITFKVGEHGPFTLVYPTMGFSPVVARAEIAKKIADIQQITQQ